MYYCLFVFLTTKNDANNGEMLSDTLCRIYEKGRERGLLLVQGKYKKARKEHYQQLTESLLAHNLRNAYREAAFCFVCFVQRCLSLVRILQCSHTIGVQ